MVFNTTVSDGGEPAENPKDEMAGHKKGHHTNDGFQWVWLRFRFILTEEAIQMRQVFRVVTDTGSKIKDTPLNGLDIESDCLN